VVHFGIGGIAELLRHEVAGIFPAQFLGLGDRAMHSAGVGRKHELGSVRDQQRASLLAHGIRHRENQVVALDRRNQRQTDSGIARGGLNDGVARLDASALLGILNHRQTNPVLDAATGVKIFELGPNLGVVFSGNPVKPDYRCVSDELQRGMRNADRHGLNFSGI
jgi:hypothetical protein